MTASKNPLVRLDPVRDEMGELTAATAGVALDTSVARHGRAF